MPTVDLLIRSVVSSSIRARQVQASFDVPERREEELRFNVELPIEDRAWTIGLIVGASGSGKTTIARHVFGDPPSLKWDASSVLDDFDPALSVNEITTACGAVGFNTIPAWLRPFAVLSNGEKFRVELARRLLEGGSLIVIDEFTSMVDRQVAHIAAHAAQKYARANAKQLVAVTCHHDVEEWLQPDWVLDAGAGTFRWRSLQRRPAIEVEISRVGYETWRLFAPFHYLTADLHRSARCFVLSVEGRPAAFAAMLHFPHPKVGDIQRLSRLVTLPDWQGMGCAAHLTQRLGGAFAAIGKRMRVYPAHRALIQSFQRGPWRLMKKAGDFSPRTGRTSSMAGDFGLRPCAVFEYSGDAWPDRDEARRLLGEVGSTT